MKTFKLLSMLLAAASLLLASCSIDNLSSVEIDDGEEYNVTLNVKIPSVMSTRNAENEVDPEEPDPDAPKPEPEPEPEPEKVLDTAVPGAATEISYLRYFVYRELKEHNPAFPDHVVSDRSVYQPTETSGTVDMYGLTATLDIKLVKDVKYRIVFWADAFGSDNSPYKMNMTTGRMTIDFDNYDIFSNQENLDAFYGYLDIEPVSGKVFSVTLKRPFAQLNIGTNIDEVKALGVSTDGLLTGIEVECIDEIPIVGDLVKGYDGEDGNHIIYKEPTIRTFKLAPRPSDNYKFPIEPNKYDYICLNYIYLSEYGGTSPLTFNYEIEGRQYSRTLNVPLERNHRTNVYGDLLTTASRIKVTIDPFFIEGNEDDFNMECDANMSPLHEAAKYQRSFVLNDDYEIYNPIVVERDFDLDLNNHTITSDGCVVFKVLSGASLTIRGFGTVTAPDSYAVWLEQQSYGSAPELYICGGNFDGGIAGTIVYSEDDFTGINEDAGEITILGGAFKNYIKTYDRVSTNLAPDLTLMEIDGWDCVVNDVIQPMSGYTLKWVEDKMDFIAALRYNDWSVSYYRYLYSRDGVTYEHYDNTLNIYPSEYGTTIDLGGKSLFIGEEFDGYNTEGGPSITIFEGIKYISNYAFSGFKVGDVTFPPTIESIGDYAFEGARINTFTAPSKLEYIGTGAFMNTYITTVNLDSSSSRLESINSEVFKGTGIQEIEFHEYISSFGAECLADCFSLKKVTINATWFRIDNDSPSMLKRNYEGYNYYPRVETDVFVAPEMKEYAKNVFRELDYIHVYAIGETPSSQGPQSPQRPQGPTLE